MMDLWLPSDPREPLVQLVARMPRSQRLAALRRLLSPLSGGAGVSFDSKFQDGASGELTPFAFTSNAPASGVSGTVGNNANRVLIAFFRARANSISIGTVAMTWNGVAMTQIGSNFDEPGSNDVICMFGLINPAVGNLVLSATWTGTPTPAPDVSIGAISLFGADQTTGWQNATTNTVGSPSTGPTITINSADGNMVVAGRTDDNSGGPHTVTAGTLDWDESDLNGNDGGAHRASVGATTTITWSLGNSQAWAMIGVDVIAAAAGLTTAQELPAFVQASGAPTAAMIMLAQALDLPITAIASVFSGAVARQLTGIAQAKGVPLPPAGQAPYLLEPASPIAATFRPPPAFSASLYVGATNQQKHAPVVVEPEPKGFCSG